jgi:hypothetical protein
LRKKKVVLTVTPEVIDLLRNSSFSLGQTEPMYKSKKLTKYTTQDLDRMLKDIKRKLRRKKR